MRRILSFILIITLVLTLSVSVSAETPTSGKFSDTVSWKLQDGVLTISGTGPIDSPIMYDYPWQSFPDKFHKVVVEEGITSIGYCCFVMCRNLEEVVLPESLEVIGRQALSQTKIKELRIPKNVHTIGEGRDAFADVSIGNEYLENIFVDDANTHYYDIDGILFCRDTSVLVCCPQQKNLDAYTVPDGIKGIGSSAFASSSLTSITLPQGLELIGPAAFIYSKLPSIKIPDTVTKIGNSAFMTSPNLKEITLPASVALVENYAFSFCDKLETVTILNPSCSLRYKNDFFPRNSLLIGYENSTLHDFAKLQGYRFRNIETDKTVDYYVEGGLAGLLPKDLQPSHAVENTVTSYSTSTGERTGYQPEAFIPPDPEHPTYKDIYNTTMEITKNCSTDRQKVEAVMKWLHKNITYGYGLTGGSFIPENVYSIWTDEPRMGNCMVYAKFTNLMLSILGIPNATASNSNHEWSLALVDGKWICVDTTNGWIADTGYEDNTTSIFFCVGDVVCVIDDFSGIKVASYGRWIDDTETTNDIYIPDYVTHIYESTFRSREYADGQEKVTVRGEKGSYAESYVRENTKAFKDYEITYEGTRFVAKPHVHTPGAYKGDIYEHWQVCSTCNATLGYYDHRFDNCSDTVCDTCGYTRKAAHDFFGDWFSNDAGHWQKCSNYNCSATSSVTAHSWNTGTTNGNKTVYTCTVCGKQKTETAVAPTTPPATVPATPPTTVPTQPPTTVPTTPPATAPTQPSTTAPTTLPTTDPSQNSSEPTTKPPVTTTPDDTTIPTETSPEPQTNTGSNGLWIALAVTVVVIAAVVTVLLLKKRTTNK